MQRAEWDLLEVESVAEAVRIASARAASLFNHLSFGDAEIEAQIWIATHGDSVRRWMDRECDAKQMASNLYSVALRKRAVRESNLAAKTTTLIDEVHRAV